MTPEVAGDTVTVADAETDELETEIVAVPTATALTAPDCDIAATAGDDEDHWAEPVMSWVEPSL